VALFGRNNHGQCNVPQLGRICVTHVACGYFNTAFLKEDGTVAIIGENGHGQCNVPYLDKLRVKQVALGG